MATRDPKTARPVPLDELIAELKKLKRAHGAQAERLARHLASTQGPTLATLKAEGDRGMWEERQGSDETYEELAERLGKTRSAVTDSVARHNRRLRGEL